jgi:ribosomal protein S12
MNEEVKKETEEKKEEVKEVKNEETQKSSKSFTEIIGSIWNSKPVRAIRKVTKWTLITGTALIGVTGAAKAGCSMALEEHDMKNSEDSDSEIPDEIPEDSDEVPNETVDSDSDSES